MKLVDVHCHLTFERFSEDLDDVVKRAKEAGMKLIITSGVEPKENRKALELSKKYPDIIRPSFGIYPVDAVASLIENVGDDSVRDIKSFDVDAELDWIRKNKDSCIAIGEVGLDYKMVENEVAQEKQREIFEKIIDLANEIDKPLVIHSRKGEADVLNILEKKKFNRVDMHCFSGKKSLIKKGVELGICFSIPSVVTRLEHFKMLIELVPIEQLLTETDAPYLAPEPGVRSEPRDVIHSIKEIARIKGISEEEASEQIYKNAKRLFKI